MFSKPKEGQSRREALLQFAGVNDVQEGVLGSKGELNIGSRADREHDPTSSHDSIPGRRTGSIWMYKKRQKFPYAWQRRLFVLLPTELRLRYFKEDDDALVACGCVDLRSLKWIDETASPTDAKGEGEDVMKFEARQIDKRRTHSFELKALKDKQDKVTLCSLIKDRLEHAMIQASLGISYALDNELKQKLDIEDKGVLVVQTWEDGPSHKGGLISYVVARKLADLSNNSASKIGDIVQAVNSVVVLNPKDLFREIRKYSVGAKVILAIKRGDAFKELAVILGSAQAYPDSYNIPIGCRIKINKT
mmetsp:Transcript_30489/g.51386  ORF Transcript_30489/g.51386 Transcript_30489/m.51386 type:complete len:305 (+) Transcript_30489:159-1073(+)|eukprot:CAMPEP_0198201960 /NCGR_PEP_ID=MMETSP1445-20131203/4994_1 /TAXON_ID=36898 /ORGANISM="Pyramimonas sp., Strain CCMP2087" /LENGTH=304 /DNA_ID=CAMNT_0043872637 /DNA_START=159 /DNA_END=1073 /DNA_ORIENTATION=-